MTKKDALHILKESFEAQGKLFDLVPEYIPKVKNYMEGEDINARLYKGVFHSFHTIHNSIQREIYKEFPDVRKEFEDIMNKKYLTKEDK